MSSIKNYSNRPVQLFKSTECSSSELTAYNVLQGTEIMDFSQIPNDWNDAVNLRMCDTSHTCTCDRLLEILQPAYLSQFLE